MKVLVLGGGESTEREVSLRSAKAVANALRGAGFDVTEADPTDGYKILDSLNDTIVFPILHGQGGEDGVIQAELEKRNLPYLGTDSKASEICFDKSLTRAVYKENGLPIAQGLTVNAENYKNQELTKKPHVLKISKGGSNIGTYLVKDPAALSQAKIDEVFHLGDEAILEELVEGVEITVPVLGDKALPVIEIQPPADQEFDYENKYNGATQEICPPKSVDESTQLKAQALAEIAHQALGCRHLSRTDIIVRPSGEIVLLETNTMPGMTDQSLFPLSAKQSGQSMVALVTQFVEMVKQDYKLG